MKNAMKRLSLVIICVMMIFTVSVVPSFAADVQNYENVIIGRAEVSDVPEARANLLPNRLLIDFDATETSIILKFKNIGVDSIDTITATVTIGSTKKSITVLKAKPGTTQKIVNINMKKCHEDISVYTVAADGGDSIGSSTTKGSRDIPSDLLNMWHRGSFSSVSASLNYHFGKHGSGVGTSNIVSYAQSAKNFKSNLSGAKSSKVNGSTPNVTRWKKNGKYIDICGSKNIGKIISYGRQ